MFEECEPSCGNGIVELSYILQALRSSENKLSHSVFTRRVCFSFFFSAIWSALSVLKAPWCCVNWWLSAWTQDIWESVGEHNMFLSMLVGSLKGFWTKTHSGPGWKTVSLDQAQAVSIHLSIRPHDHHLFLFVNVVRLSSCICCFIMKLSTDVVSITQLSTDCFVFYYGVVKMSCLLLWCFLDLEIWRLW